MKKKLLIVSGVLVVVVVGIAVLLLANINRVIESQRGTILSRVETQLGRKVMVGEISASLWPGIGVRVQDVSVADDASFASEPFLAATAVRVNVRLRPLLRRRVEIKRLVLEEPRLTLIRKDDGVLNIDGLMGASGGAAREGGGAKSLPLILAFADVQDGEIHYVDASKRIDWTVRRIDFTARDVSLESEVSFELTAAVVSDDPDVSISGRAGPAGDLESLNVQNVPLALDVEIGPVAARALLGAMPDYQLPPDVRLGDDGRVKATLKLSGTVGAIQLEGMVDATDVAVDVEDRFHKPAGMPTHVTFSGTAAGGVAEISGFDATLGEIVLKGSGRFGRDMHVRVAADGVDLGKLAPLLPALAALALEGRCAIDATVDRAGEPDAKPLVAGSMTVAGAGGRVEGVRSPVRDANGTVHFTSSSASVENATFSVGASQMTMTGQATSLQPLGATFRVTSNKILRGDFQELPATPLPRPDVLSGVAVTGTMRADAAGAVTTTADARSSSGVLSNIDYKDLSSTIRSTSDAVVIERYSASALEGTISGDGTFHPTADPPTFELTTKTQRVNVAAYIRSRFPAAADVLEGRIDVDLKVAGSGKKWEDVQKTVNGSGAGAVLEGVLLNMNIARELVDGVQTIPGVPAGFTQKMIERNPGLFREKRTAFKNLAGNIRIQNGRVETGNLSVLAGEFDITGGGWVGFNQQMGLTTTVVLSPRLTSQVIAELPVAKYLARADGRLELPLLIGGETTRPRITMDVAGLTQRIQDGLVGDGTDAVKDKLGDLIKGFGKKRK